jgi:hypothetical protein
MQVFISHASTESDTRLASALADALRRAGLSPWLDDERLPPGVRPEDQIRAAIGASECAVFLISGSWLERKWCQWELEQFGLRRPTPVMIALLRQPRDELERLLGPDLSPLTNLEWPDTAQAPEECFWRLYCGLQQKGPGPRSEWAACGAKWWRVAGAGGALPPAAPALRESQPPPLRESQQPALRESKMRGPYTAISTTCDRAKQWGLLVTHASLPRHELLALVGPRGFGHRQLLSRIAQGMTDPPRVVKEVSWGDRRPETIPDLLELLLRALADQPPSSGSLEARVADQLSALLASRNVVLLHPPVRGGFDRSALTEYYTSVLPRIAGAAQAVHHVKCVQPVEWLPSTVGERIAAGLQEVLGAFAAPPADALESAAIGFVNRVKDTASANMPVTVLPVLDAVPVDELREFAERLELSAAGRARLLRQVLAVAKTPDEIFEAIDDYYPEVRGTDQP